MYDSETWPMKVTDMQGLERVGKNDGSVDRWCDT